MEIDWLRDLMIVVSSGVLVVVAIAIGIIVFLTSRHIRALADSAKNTLETVKDMSQVISHEMARPAIRKTATIASIFEAVSKFRSIFQKK